MRPWCDWCCHRDTLSAASAAICHTAFRPHDKDWDHITDSLTDVRRLQSAVSVGIMMEDVEASPASKKSSGHLHIGKLTGCSCNFAPRNQWNLPNILA